MISSSNCVWEHLHRLKLEQRWSFCFRPAEKILSRMGLFQFFPNMEACSRFCQKQIVPWSFLGCYNQKSWSFQVSQLHKCSTGKSSVRVWVCDLHRLLTFRRETRTNTDTFHTHSLLDTRRKQNIYCLSLFCSFLSSHAAPPHLLLLKGSWTRSVGCY